MIVVVDVIMLWPVVTRKSGRGQCELRELSSRADWYYYHHHFPELHIQSPKSPKDNHLYLGQKINVVCPLINFVLVPQKHFQNLDGLKVEQKQIACSNRQLHRDEAHHPDKWSTRTSCEHLFYFSVCTICGQWKNCKIKFSQHLYSETFECTDVHFQIHTWYLEFLISFWVDAHIHCFSKSYPVNYQVKNIYV